MRHGVSSISDNFFMVSNLFFCPFEKYLINSNYKQKKKELGKKKSQALFHQNTYIPLLTIGKGKEKRKEKDKLANRFTWWLMTLTFFCMQEKDPKSSLFCGLWVVDFIGKTEWIWSQNFAAKRSPWFLYCKNREWGDKKEKQAIRKRCLACQVRTKAFKAHITQALNFLVQKLDCTYLGQTTFAKKIRLGIDM